MMKNVNNRSNSTVGVDLQKGCGGAGYLQRCKLSFNIVLWQFSMCDVNCIVYHDRTQIEFLPIGYGV